MEKYILVSSASLSPKVSFEPVDMLRRTDIPITIQSPTTPHKELVRTYRVSHPAN